MIIERLEATLARDEGKDLKRHDVDGIAHIGVGRNLEGRGLTDEEMEYLDVTDEDELHEITEEQSKYLFENDLQLATEICYNIIGDGFNNLSDVRQEVLLNMAFNMGEPRLRRFKKMWAAIEEQDWEEAADEMLDSKAAKQTGKRYERLANAMENDDGDAFEVDYGEVNDVTVDPQFDTPEAQALVRLTAIETDLKSVNDKVAKIDDRLEGIEKNLSTLIEILNKPKTDKKKLIAGLI